MALKYAVSRYNKIGLENIKGNKEICVHRCLSRPPKIPYKHRITLLRTTI